MHSYVILALFGCIQGGLESRFCRYLRDSRPLLAYPGRAGKQILSLFAVDPPSEAVWAIG